MSEISIDQHFLGYCFYCYSQQFISVLANESVIPYNLKNEHQERRTFNIAIRNAKPNQINKIQNTTQFLEQNTIAVREQYL